MPERRRGGAALGPPGLAFHREQAVAHGGPQHALLRRRLLETVRLVEEDSLHQGGVAGLHVRQAEPAPLAKREVEQRGVPRLDDISAQHDEAGERGQRLVGRTHRRRCEQLVREASLFVASHGFPPV